MPTGVQLQDLLRDLRAEAGHALSIAQGAATQETLSYLLRRTQEMLWVEYDWPMRRAIRPLAVSTGTRYLDFPSDMDMTGIDRAVFQYSGTLQVPLEYGIDLCHYGELNPELPEDRGLPRRWDVSADTGQIELWPVSDRAGTVVLDGQKALSPLVAQTDRCTLDSTLIVLRAAGEVLARQKSSDAELKIQMAARYAQRLLVQQRSEKSRPIIIGGGADPNMGGRRQLRPGLDYIP